MALMIRVFPVPGGPKRSTPLMLSLRPLNKPGIKAGSITFSLIRSLTLSSPAISLKVIGFASQRNNDKTYFTSSGFKP